MKATFNLSFIGTLQKIDVANVKLYFQKHYTPQLKINEIKIEKLSNNYVITIASNISALLDVTSVDKSIEKIEPERKTISYHSHTNLNLPSLNESILFDQLNELNKKVLELDEQKTSFELVVMKQSKEIKLMDAKIKKFEEAENIKNSIKQKLNKEYDKLNSNEQLS